MFRTTPFRRGAMACVAMGLGLGLAVPAQAARKEVVVLIYHSQSPNIRDGLAAERANVGAEVAVSMHSSEVHDPAGEFEAFGDGGIQNCTTGPADEEVSDVLAAVNEKLADELWDEALRDFDRAVGQLGCQERPVEARDLGQLHYLHGVTLHALGRGDEANAAFQAALAIDPQFPGHPDYAAANEEMEWQRASVSGNEVPVHVLTGERERRELRVDGRVLSESGLSLLPGRHLLQLSSGGRAVSWLIEVEASASPLIVVHRNAHSRALRMAATDEAFIPYVAEVVTPHLEAADVDRADLVDVEASSAEMSGWVYRRSTGELIPRSLDLFSDRQAAAALAQESSGTVADVRRQQRGADRLRGFAGVNFGVRVNAPSQENPAYPYFTVPVTVSLALPNGFGFDLGVQFDISSWTDESTGQSHTVLAPWGRVGFGYHGIDGMVRPVLVGQFVISVDDKEGFERRQANFGGIAMLGIDLVPRDPFAIRIVADVGYVRSGFVAGFHVGPGFVF